MLSTVVQSTTLSLLKDDVTTRLSHCGTRKTGLQDRQAKPPSLHTPALGAYTWNSHCGSKTWRSTTLLLGLVLLARKTHAFALDDGRPFRSLVLPVHQEPSQADRGHRHCQQTDTRAVTNPVGRSELGLINLWSLARRYAVSYKCTYPWQGERLLSLTTMPISCVTPYKATVESVRISSAPGSSFVRSLTLVIPIANPALVVPLVALMRSVREGTVSASPCTKV